MPKIKVGEVNLYYETHGTGDPVLLVPGLGGAGSYWQPQIGPFAERYQVVPHDHRGTGQSDHVVMKYSVDQMTDDVLGLMDALGIERAHLVGHSTGGAIGQIMAIEHPERLRSLVIANSWTKADPFFIRCFDVRSELLRKSGAAAYQHAAPVFLFPSWWIRDNAEKIAQAEEASLPSFPPAEIMLSRIEAIVAFDRTQELSKIQTPTLVVCARDDHLTPAYYSEELAAAIPGAKLAMLDHGGHSCSMTVPEEFNKRVLSFLAEH
jgi:aminoacrylate hydrolase